MRYAILILICTFITSLSSAQKTEKKYFKDSDKVQMEIFTEDSIKTFNEYYESGKLKNVFIWVKTGTFDWKIDGDNIMYFEDGTISAYYHWNKGILAGRAYANFADGSLSFEKNFKDGYRAGTSKYYNKDGTVRREQIFEEYKCTWDDETEIAKNKYYWKEELAYIEDITDNKTKSIKVVNESAYKQLMAENPVTGKKIFQQNCASCHSPKMDIVGPMLHGIAERRTDAWLYKMITNGDALLKSGDVTAIEVYKKWQGARHINFEILTKPEVDAIIEYIKLF